MEMESRPSGAKAESRFRALAALVSPTLLGIFVIVSVITGEGVGHEVSDSELVSSVALVVGAALILGSAAIYLRSPGAYEDFEQIHTEQFEALVDQAKSLRALSSRLESEHTAGGAPDDDPHSHK
jgi:hypothetical protein